MKNRTVPFNKLKAVNGIILLRIKGQDSLEKIKLLERLIDRHRNKIVNHFVVITKDKFRFIPMEVI